MKYKMILMWALLAMFIFAGTLLTGCGDDDDDDDDNDDEDDDDTTDDDDTADDDDDVPTGDAILAFEPTYGSAAGQQFSANWKMSIPGYDTDSKVLVMLCETDDETCTDPVLVREMTDAENTDDGIMQNSWGPDVVMETLPAGDWKLQIIVDSTDSRDMGFGWDDDFDTKETEWGGIVSESDMMLADPEDHPELGHNPEPMAWDVTLTDFETTDLGTIALEHYHQRDISPDPTTENGLIVVGTGQGARVVDLTDFSVQTAYSSKTEYYEYVMVDDAGDAVDGMVCGAAAGPDDTIFLLFLNGTVDRAGFAIQFDPIAGQQLNGSYEVSFPGGGQDFPCRGLYHEYNGEDYLWVTNSPADTADSESGFWYANITDLSSGDVEAGFVDDGDVFADGVDRMAALEDTLYLGADSGVSGCDGYNCAFEADFNTTTGEPTLRDDKGYTIYKGDLLDGDYDGDESYSCVNPAPTMGMTIAEFHDGHALLFIGNCLSINVFDLDTGDEFDYNGAGPGTAGFNGVYFGQGFTDFSLSPDGDTLWVVPATKSLVHFCALKGNGNRQTYNRYMLLPLDLSQGDMPEIVAEYNVNDLDDYEGKDECSTMTYSSPAVDPGVDLDFFYLKKYIVEWAADLAGGTPTSIPVGPTIAAANETVWMRGSGVTGVSGLANQGNLGVFDLDAQKVVLWPRGDEPYYKVWTSGTDTKWGFDLTPENDDSVETKGIFYIPLD